MNLKNLLLLVEKKYIIEIRTESTWEDKGNIYYAQKSYENYEDIPISLLKLPIKKWRTNFHKDTLKVYL